MFKIEKPISIDKLKKIAQTRFGNLVKAVIDINKEIVVIDADLHSDQEAMMLKEGSKQNNLWGINLYPELFGTNDFIEFDSMINIRPSQGNMSRAVDKPEIQKKIRKVIDRLIR